MVKGIVLALLIAPYYLAILALILSASAYLNKKSK